MRRLAPLGLALCALALAVPPAARAGGPGGPNCAGNGCPARPDSSPNPEAADSGSVRAGWSSGYLCPRCQIEQALSEANGAPVVITGPNPESLPPLGMVVPAGASMPMPVGTVTGPVPHQHRAGRRCAACEAASAGVAVEPPGLAALNQEAPGYANLVARRASSEPMPIGVVRTSYNGPAPGGYPPHGPMMMGRGNPAASGPNPAANPNPMSSSTPMGFTNSRRPHPVRYLFGLDTFGQISARRAERRAAEHAALPLGSGPPTAPVSKLPAPVVYGRR